MVSRYAFASAFLGLSLHAIAQTPLGDILSAESSHTNLPTVVPSTATITLQGATIDEVTASHGLSIRVADQYEDGTASSDIISVGTFTLRRTKGNFLWKYLNAAKEVMSLDENGTLALSDPLGAPDIVLTPGAGGGITIGGARVPTSADVNWSFGGGSVASDWTGVGDPPTYAAPGLLALGAGARAVGPGAIAIGSGAQAMYWTSLALGQGTTANVYSTALGYNAQATGNRCVAIGSGAHAYGESCYAIGFGTYAYGVYGMSLGASMTGPDWYSAALNGVAWGPRSVAVGWGQSDGDSSIALGGTTEGYKSLAVNSGFANGDYATAIGRGTVTRLPYQVVLGTYNALDYSNSSVAVPGSSPAANGNPNPGAIVHYPSHPDDPLFVIGNGTVDESTSPPTEHRSNAFTVSYNGNAKVQNAVEVGRPPSAAGVPAANPTTSVFHENVKVEGVLRVAPAGDIDMGAFTDGMQP